MMKILLSIAVSVALLAGCSSAYYGTMEKFGVHKRDIMVDRVEEARDSQKEGEEQFKTSLEAFKSVTSFDGGELEDVYNRLNDEYEDSKESAEEISEHIDEVDDVATAMFKEWQDELKEYSSASLRRDSENQLKATEARYRQMIAAMRKTEERMTPVLDAMQDQVLYLKHNLNARAIASLKTEVVKIDKNVDSLLAAMQKSIAEADVFIEQMKQ